MFSSINAYKNYLQKISKLKISAQYNFIKQITITMISNRFAQKGKECFANNKVLMQFQMFRNFKISNKTYK